jgi:hypothetical protein
MAGRSTGLRWLALFAAGKDAESGFHAWKSSHFGRSRELERNEREPQAGRPGRPKGGKKKGNLSGN